MKMKRVSGGRRQAGKEEKGGSRQQVQRLGGSRMWFRFFEGAGAARVGWRQWELVGDEE